MIIGRTNIVALGVHHDDPNRQTSQISSKGDNVSYCDYVPRFHNNLPIHWSRACSSRFYDRKQHLHDDRLSFPWANVGSNSVGNWQNLKFIPYGIGITICCAPPKIYTGFMWQGGIPCPLWTGSSPKLRSPVAQTGWFQNLQLGEPIVLILC